MQPNSSRILDPSFLFFLYIQVGSLHLSLNKLYKCIANILNFNYKRNREEICFPSLGYNFFSSMIKYIHQYSLVCRPRSNQYFFFFSKHISKIWCYCRLVYMSISYMYEKRFVGPITPLILQLRNELHTQPYNKISWRNVRHQCAKVSVTVP